jgi:predicted component of type VI protein secretion system
MGEAAPDFVGSENSENLGAAVRDCLKVAQQLVQQKTGGPEMADSANAVGPNSAGGSVVTRNLATRADAYRMLGQAADMLQQIEPHSPIPYFIRRCVKLGQLQFPDLMKALIRENAVIDELNRLMGMEAEQPPPG